MSSSLLGLSPLSPYSVLDINLLSPAANAAQTPPTPLFSSWVYPSSIATISSYTASPTAVSSIPSATSFPSTPSTPEFTTLLLLMDFPSVITPSITELDSDTPITTDDGTPTSPSVPPTPGTTTPSTLSPPFPSTPSTPGETLFPSTPSNPLALLLGILSSSIQTSTLSSSSELPSPSLSLTSTFQLTLLELLTQTLLILLTIEQTLSLLLTFIWSLLETTLSFEETSAPVETLSSTLVEPSTTSFFTLSEETATTTSYSPTTSDTTEEDNSTVRTTETSSETTPTTTYVPPTTTKEGSEAYTLTIVSPDTTVVEVVAVPLSTAKQDNHGGTLSKNAKLIGGLVGSIGGVLVIGGLVVLFMLLRRKRRNHPNQLPDFHDDSLLEEKGFKKLFSGSSDLEATPNGFDDSVAAGGYGAAGFSRDTPTTYQGLSARLGLRLDAATAVAAAAASQSVRDPDNRDLDFVYRGVANQNLDRVFRGPSTKSTSRALAPYPFDDPHGSSSDDDFDFNEYDEDLITTPPRPQHNVFGNPNGSNNSQLRFHEEI